MHQDENETLQLQPCTNVEARHLSECFRAIIVCFQLLAVLVPHTMAKNYRTYSLVSYVTYASVLPVVCVVGLVGCALLLNQVKEEIVPPTEGKTYIVQFCQSLWRRTNRLRMHATMLTVYDCILILSSLCAYSRLCL